MKPTIPFLLCWALLLTVTASAETGVEAPGLYQEFYNNGQPKMDWAVDEAGGTVLFKKYFQDGRVMAEGTYRDGKLDGLYREYYSDGQVSLETVFAAGKAEGPYKRYAQDGVLLEDGQYRNDVLEGAFRFYYPNGQIKEDTVYAGGKPHGLSRAFYENGLLKSTMHYLHGQREGESATYHETGALSSQGTFVQDRLEGLVTSFYPSGILQSEIRYQNGEPEGVLREYSEQGVLRSPVQEPEPPTEETSSAANTKGALPLVLQALIFDTTPQTLLAELLLIFCLGWGLRGLFEKFLPKKLEKVETAVPVQAEPSSELEPLAREFNLWNSESQQLYRRLIETVDTGIFLADLSGRVKYGNLAFAKILGHDAKIKVLGANLKDEFQEMNTYAEGFWERISRERMIKDYPLKRKAGDGTDLILSFSGHQILDDKGVPVGVECLITDITEKHRLSEALMNEKKKIEAILEFHERIDALRSVEELTRFAVQEAARILECPRCSLMLQAENTEILRIVSAYGLSEEIIKNAQENLGDPVAGHLALHGKPVLVKNIEYDKVFSRANKAGYLGRSFIVAPFRLRNQSLGVFNAADKIGPDGQVQPFTETDLKILTILTAKTAAAMDNLTTLASLNLLTVTDPMTQMFNYRRFLESLEHEIASERRNPTALCIAMIDMDHFKSYNDNFGHLEGDALLRTFGRILKEQLRETDIICRYAGDEFCVVLPGTPADGAQKAAEKLRAYVAAYTFKGPITLSIGIAQYQPGMTVKDFIQKADQGLYAAKHAGRNRVVVQGDDSSSEIKS